MNGGERRRAVMVENDIRERCKDCAGVNDLVAAAHQAAAQQAIDGRFDPVVGTIGKGAPFLRKIDFSLDRAAARWREPGRKQARERQPREANVGIVEIGPLGARIEFTVKADIN